jgi:hypothetical protein
MEEPREDTDERPLPASAPLRSLPSGLFAAWRRVIASIASVFPRLGRSAHAAAITWVAQWKRTGDYHRHSPEPWTDDGRLARQAAAALGVRAFVFGMVVAAIATAASRGLWGPAVATAGSEVLWASMRFIIVALLMPAGTIDRSRLSIAYLAGLLPYAFGATWLLRLLALGFSGLLTARGLLGAGVPRRHVRTVIGWSFGGQAAVIGGELVLRAIVALLAFG